VLSAIGSVPQRNAVMAKGTSPAKRTNRALATLTFLALVGASVAAAFGSGPNASSTSTTTPSAPSINDIPGSRPAETALSWFDHGFAVEQFDYEMDELSCDAVEKTITPDLCAVVGSGDNAFMMVGAEGYWDPEDQDSEGSVWVPLNVTLFSLRTDNKMSRAVSVLDGLIEKQYTSNRAQLDAFTTTINGVTVLVLHKHLSAANADPYDLFDELQVIAASPTGAPTVVATYRGPQIAVQATPNSLEISSLRYRPTADTPDAKWFTRISLSPNDSPFGMTEVVTSGSSAVENGEMLTSVGSYKFPVGRGAKSDSPTA
jgi:hypothetical protein